MAKIRVFLADDHTVVRQGLRALLVAEEDMDIVGEAENGRQAIELVKKLLPDVVVRQGLRALLVAEEDMDIVGEAENGRQAIELVKKLLPDVVVMDVAMPTLNGAEATRQIRESAPATKVLVAGA